MVSDVPRLTPDADLQIMDDSDVHRLLTQAVNPSRSLCEMEVAAKEDPEIRTLWFPFAAPFPGAGPSI